MEELPQTLHETPKSTPGLRGRELVAWALGEGVGVVPQLNPIQERYFKTMSREAGVSWPKGFFASTVEKLIGR